MVTVTSGHCTVSWALQINDRKYSHMIFSPWDDEGLEIQVYSSATVQEVSLAAISDF